MIVRPYHHCDAGCAAYLFGCGPLGKCAVVDAQERDVEEYDHRSGGPALADRAGAAYCLHAPAPTQRSFQRLEDGEEIDLGNTRVRVLHTPGHTPESMREAFVDVVADVPPKPAEMEHVLRFNVGQADERPREQPHRA